MHLPIIICGFICGWKYGLLTGAMTPLLRCIPFSMPAPVNAICMAFELAAYGLVAGFLHNQLPKKKVNVYVSLLCAMIIGRIVWGVVMFGCMGFDMSQFGFSAFLAGAVLNAIPGIVLQVVLVPIIVITLERFVNKNN